MKMYVYLIITQSKSSFNKNKRIQHMHLSFDEEFSTVYSYHLVDGIIVSKGFNSSDNEDEVKIYKCAITQKDNEKLHRILQANPQGTIRDLFMLLSLWYEIKSNKYVFSMIKKHHYKKFEEILKRYDRTKEKLFDSHHLIYQGPITGYQELTELEKFGYPLDWKQELAL